jgi:hypothetical protein
LENASIDVRIGEEYSDEILRIPELQDFVKPAKKDVIVAKTLF